MVMILCPFKPMYPLAYRDMDAGNTGDYHAPSLYASVYSYKAYEGYHKGKMSHTGVQRGINLFTYLLFSVIDNLR